MGKEGYIRMILAPIVGMCSRFWILNGSFRAIGSVHRRDSYAVIKEKNKDPHTLKRGESGKYIHVVDVTRKLC